MYKHFYVEVKITNKTITYTFVSFVGQSHVLPTLMLSLYSGVLTNLQSRILHF